MRGFSAGALQRLIVVAVWLCAGIAPAQQTGSVAGVVRNQSGVPLAGASVTASASDDSVAKFTAVSDANGGYRLTGLKPGVYVVILDAAGFVSAKKQIVLNGTEASADFTLAPAPIKFEAAGVRGLIDPGGYSVPAAAASASGLVTGMADIQRQNNTSAKDWGCGREADFKQTAESGVPEALLRLGEFYLARGRFQEASLPLQTAFNKKPEASTLRLLAESYEGSGKFAEAAAAYSEAVEIDASEEDLFGAGYEMILAGSAESAAVSFRKALGKRPQSYLLWIGNGAAEFLAGHFDLAATALLRAIDLKPAEPSAYEYLARVVDGSGTVSPVAEEALRRFAEIAPQNARALYDYALILRSKHLDDKSEELLRRSIAIDPRFADAHLALGELLASRGDKGNALNHYRQAVDLSPGLAKAHYRLAMLYRLNGDGERASQELNAFAAAKAQSKSGFEIDLSPFVSMLGGRAKGCPDEKP